MATKNTKDNTYYSVSKAFTFSSWILLLVPVVELILGLLYGKAKVVNEIPEIAYKILAIIALVFILIWTVLNVIMFVCAGNLRGLKSPLGIRFGLFISLIFVFAGAIIYIVSSYVPEMPLSPKIWAIIIAVLQVLGLLIAAILGHKIKKALR